MGRFYRQIIQVQINSLLSQPTYTAERLLLSCIQSAVFTTAHVEFIVFIKSTHNSQVEKINKMARQKCPFPNSRVFYSSQKMKAGNFHSMFLFLEEEGQKYVIFISVLTQQSFFKVTARNALGFLPAFSMLQVKDACLIINPTASPDFLQSGFAVITGQNL